MKYTPEYIDLVTHYCQVCHSKKFYVLLGSHLWQKHGVTADEYRESLGLAKNVRLIDKTIQEKKRAYITPEIIESLTKHGRKHGFKKGFGGRPAELVSEMTKEKLSLLHRTREPESDLVCGRCKNSFKGFRWRVYCDDCITLQENDSQERLRKSGYYSQYAKKRRKDPEWVKSQTEKHREYVEKNREKVRAKHKVWLFSKTCSGCGCPINRYSKSGMCIHCFNKKK